MAASNELNLKVERDTFALLLGELRKKEEFIDVQLQINDKLFPSHRVVLSVNSPVLKAMISDQWLTTKICQLSSEFVDEEIMEDLLNFLYTGEIKLTPDNAYPVCVAAHFLQISILLEPAAKFLCKQIVADNVLPLYLFAKSRDIDLLVICCLRFLSTEFGKVFQDSLILDFPFQDLKDLIVRLRDYPCDLKIWENIFLCIVCWAEKNLLERSAILPVLLENVPLDDLSHKFLTQTISTYPFGKESLSTTRPLLKEFSNSEDVSKIKQKLIVIGSRNWLNKEETSMLCFDPQTKVWDVLPNMLQARTHFGAVVMERNIIVGGGYGTEYEKSMNSVEMFEWSSQKWRVLSILPFGLANISMAIYNGQLYVAGGNIDKGKPLSRVMSYSFETSEWRNIKSMNVARIDGHLIAYKNYLYIIGGGTNTVERYDPILDEWTMMASMENPHRNFSATLHQNKIYICKKEDFQVYDIKKNVWNSLPGPAPGLGTNLVSMNGKLLAIGGYLMCSGNNPIQEFDFLSQRWVKFDKLPSKFAHEWSLSGPFY